LVGVHAEKKHKHGHHQIGPGYRPVRGSRQGGGKGIVVYMKNGIARKPSVDIDDMRSEPGFGRAEREVLDFQKTFLGGSESRPLRI
jgi:hypothetical protein